MKNIVIIGAGMSGSTIAAEFATRADIGSIVVVDTKETAKKVNETFGREPYMIKTNPMQYDFADTEIQEEKGGPMFIPKRGKNRANRRKNKRKRK